MSSTSRVGEHPADRPGQAVGSSSLGRVTHADRLKDVEAGAPRHAEPGARERAHRPRPACWKHPRGLLRDADADPRWRPSRCGRALVIQPWESPQLPTRRRSWPPTWPTPQRRKIIRLAMPPTEERRKQLRRPQDRRGARIAIRNIRREANKTEDADKKVSEDDEPWPRQSEGHRQVHPRVDELLKKKEQEILCHSRVCVR